MILELDDEGAGLTRTAAEIKRINDPDVNMYAVITNTAVSGIAGRGYISGACDNTNCWKTSLSRGPGRKQDLRESAVATAEVTSYNLVIMILIF